MFWFYCLISSQMCSLLYIIVIHTNNFTDKIKPIFFTSRIFNFFEEQLPVVGGVDVMARGDDGDDGAGDDLDIATR